MTDDTNETVGAEAPEGMTSVAPPEVQALSLSDKFVGVLTEPAPTYENVRAAGPRTSDWLVPVFLTALILVVGMFIRFSNPEFMAQITEQQSKALQQRVDSGEMTAEQAEQAIEQGAKFTKILGPIGAGIGYIVVFFILALLYWLVVRFVMRGDVNYSLILSAAGLAAFIGAIDQVVSLLLFLVTGKAFANLSPALFLGGDVSSMSHRVLMILNPIGIWSYYVLGIGFEKVAAISRTKAMIAAFGFFVLVSLGSIFGAFGGM